MDIVIKLFMSIFVVAGIALGINTAFHVYLSIASTSWPYVEGQIIESRTVLGGSYKSSLKIVYSYQVSKITYTNDEVNFSGMIQTTDQAIDWRQYYKVGNSVSVYYDPSYPGTSVLETGFDKNIYKQVFVSICFVVFGLIGFRKGMKSIPNHK